MTVKLNAEYFENQGREYALADAKTAHKLAELNRAPIKGGSWQRKAWDRGYEAGLAQKHHEECFDAKSAPVASCHACDAGIPTRSAVNLMMNRISDTGNAISQHIDSLHEMALVDTDEKRCRRLKAKADKLHRKWFGS